MERLSIVQGIPIFSGVLWGTFLVSKWGNAAGARKRHKPRSARSYMIHAERDNQHLNAGARVPRRGEVQFGH